VLGVDRATGDVLWKIGGTATPESLAVSGDTSAPEGFGGQHNVRLNGAGALSVHDNGAGRGRAPRVARYSLDPGAGTAAFIDELSDPAVTSSMCCGSGERLAGGNWVVSWGGVPVIAEYGPAGDALLRLSFSGAAFSYRVAPGTFGVIGREELRAAMDSMYPRKPPPPAADPPAPGETPPATPGPAGTGGGEAEPTPLSPPAVLPPRPCIVPRLLGKTLENARRAVRRARCSVGRTIVRRRPGRSRVLRVRAQRPGPGERLPRLARVTVVLGR
jgi:hypothetical protein